MKWWAKVAVLLVVGVLLRAPALGAGFILDDHIQLAMLDGQGWYAAPPWDLYAFVRPRHVPELMQIGTMPWWTAPKLLGAPFRPLSSLLIWSELKLFGPSPLPLHVLSFVWWSACVLAVARLARMLLSPQAALIAVAAYVFSAAHGLPLVWIANRCALVATTFGALALGAQVAAWKGRGPIWGVMPWLALSLVSGEYGLSVMALMIGLELFAAPGGLRARAVRLAPVLALALSYQLAVRGLDYGMKGTGLYLDPLNTPLAFAARALVQWPSFLSQGLLGYPFPPGNVVVIVLSALALFGLPALIAWLPGSTAAKRLERGLMLAIVLGCAPLTAAFYAPRLLVGVAIGSSLLAGSLLCRAATAIRDSDRSLLVRALYVTSCTPLVLGFFVTAPILSGFEVFAFTEINAAADRAAVQAPVGKGPAILVSAFGPFGVHHAALVRAEAGLDTPGGWWVLSAAPGAHRVTRISDRVLEVQTGPGRGLYSSATAVVYRDPTLGPRPGESLIAGPITVAVLEGDTSGPTRWRMTFDFALPVHLLVSTATGFDAVATPTIGQSVNIPGAVLPGAR